MSMRLLFIGPQGSGKGTQAAKFSEYLNIPHISTGDLFRQSEGELGFQVMSYINQGHLVPDNLTLQVLRNRISQKDTKNGFMLDGYPRNLKQAKSLDSIFNVDKIVVLNLSEKESVRRISGRVVCKSCSKGYNTLTDPPKKKGICNTCGDGLIQRYDDKPEAIKQRLAIYQEKTKPIIDYYGNKGVGIIEIDGEGTIEDIFEEIKKRLGV